MYPTIQPNSRNFSRHAAIFLSAMVYRLQHRHKPHTMPSQHHGATNNCFLFGLLRLSSAFESLSNFIFSLRCVHAETDYAPAFPKPNLLIITHTKINKQLRVICLITTKRKTNIPLRPLSLLP